MFSPGASGLMLMGGISLHPYTVAYLAQFVTPLDSARIKIIDTFVRALVSYNIWTKFGHLGIHALPVQQQSLVNLVNPAHATFGSLVIVGSPVFTANVGWRSTGAYANRLQTGGNANDATLKFGQNNASFGVFANPTVNQNACIISSSTGNSRIAVQYNGNPGHFYLRMNMAANSSLALGGGGPGLFACNRTAYKAWQSYKNGSPHASSTNASTAVPASPFLICADFSGGVTGTSTVRLSFIGASMTATEHANFYTACNALITDLAAV